MRIFIICLNEISVNLFPRQVIAEYLQKVDPKSDGAKRDWVAIYDECANVLYQVVQKCNRSSIHNIYYVSYTDSISISSTLEI